jgi:dipeptidyl aminopeptidase/acylaminoacyl peptidase
MPFWSPDSRFVGFFADNKLKKLDVASGVIEDICPAGYGYGASWNQENVILFNPGEGTGLLRVNATAGTSEVITELAADTGSFPCFPSFLPDGKHYLFQRMRKDNSGIYVGSLGSQERKLLIPLGADLVTNSTQAVWSSAGYILYVRNRTTLLAQAFDANRLELKGEPFRVAENVIVTQAGVGRFTISANGTLAFIQGGESDTVQLAWHDQQGKPLGPAGPAARWGALGFDLSPDKRFAALIREEPNRLDSVWIVDLVQNSTTRFVAEGANFNPVWSPDSKHLAFSSARKAPPNLFIKPLSGNEQEERVWESSMQSHPTSWSPDGRYLVYHMVAPETQSDIWVLPLVGERKPQALFQTKAVEWGGKVSPDGNWMAYVSNESGGYEVYVTQFPRPVRSWRISTNGGEQPNWRGDGKELYFVAGNKLMAVSVTLGTAVQVGTPQPLFEIEGTQYAPSKDGQRFLVPVVTEKAPAPPSNVVLNWTADLQK